MTQTTRDLNFEIANVRLFHPMAYSVIVEEARQDAVKQERERILKELTRKNWNTIEMYEEEHLINCQLSKMMRNDLLSNANLTEADFDYLNSQSSLGKEGKKE